MVSIQAATKQPGQEPLLDQRATRWVSIHPKAIRLPFGYLTRVALANVRPVILRSALGDEELALSDHAKLGTLKGSPFTAMVGILRYAQDDS
jgi:hypothetical protein